MAAKPKAAPIRICAIPRRGCILRRYEVMALPLWEGRRAREETVMAILIAVGVAHRARLGLGRDPAAALPFS
jgi:hypothetical protein